MSGTVVGLFAFEVIAGQITNIGDPLNEPPVADASGPYDGLEGSPVALDGTGSSDPDGDVLTFSWSDGVTFDDATSMTVASACRHKSRTAAASSSRHSLTDSSLVMR